MDLKSVIETGSEVLAEQVGKLTAALPQDVPSLAESTIGKEIASLVKTVAQKVESSNGTSPGAAAAGAPTAEAPTSATVPAPSPPPAVEVAPPSAGADLGSGGAASWPHKGLIVGGAVVAGVAAAGFVLWRRRHAEAAQDESPWAEGPTAVVTPIGGTAADEAAAAPDEDEGAADVTGAAAVAAADVLPADDTSASMSGSGDEEVTDVAQDEPFEAGVAADQLPDTVDPELAAQIDAEADHFASDFIDHVDTEETTDPEYDAEIDAEADHFAADFVAAVEVTDEELPKDA